ncbi:unnamed protein product [Prunus armeniaca]
MLELSKTDISLPLLGEFSKTLLMSSRQIIKARTILLPSIDILSRGQSTNFLLIIAQQPPAATAVPIVFGRQSRRQPAWSHPTSPRLEKEKTKKNLRARLTLGCTATPLFDKQYKILQDLSQARK